ncbi:addiction module protein [Haloferula sp. BvORR071]|uniref:addiction module protein n=1 Tax=Haloferula sp. BvORR071 TaxID=1396141 RepID=UPI00054EA756|nr:addiction module protein [Haloferula sp. BvORR071]
MDALTLEQEALKLPPLARIQLAELLYASLEAERDQEWEAKVSTELNSRWEAYQKGELGSSQGFEFLDRIESRAPSQ